MKSVLVVEDKDSFLKVIQYLMRKQGYQVTLARNGAEALSRLHERHIDLMITNFQMPIMSAPELLCAIRSSKCFSELPVILVPAKGFDREIERVDREYGLLNVVKKPFSPNHLAQIVNNHFSGACHNLP